MVPKKIFVVDDQLMVLQVAAAQLERLGLEVAVFQTPKEALSSTICPMALLTDITMPGMSGVEFAKKMVKRHPGLPVFFMTGHGFGEEVDAGKLGPVLLKPISKKDIQSALIKANLISI